MLTLFYLYTIEVIKLVKLIKYFNDNYGQQYGNIDYPRTTIQIYKVYQAIKSYGINDNKLIELLHNIKLPNPKSVEEKELYTDCLYNKDDNEFERDIFDTKEKKCLYKNTLSVKDGTYQKSYASYIFEDIDAPFELNQNNSYYIILNGEILSNIIDLSSYTLTISRNEGFAVEVSLDGATAELGITLPSEVDIINFSLWENDECIFETQLLSQDAEEEEIVKDNYTFEINEDFNFDNYSSYYFVINNEIYKNKYRIINNSIELYSEDLDLYIGNDSIHIEKNNIKDYINIELWEEGEKNIKNSYLDKDVVIRKSLSIGENTSATNNCSFAQGYNVSASGKHSHAEGRNTTALGETSHSEGGGTNASGVCSHAEGSSSVASGLCTHAEGQGSKASGNYSHAEGFETKTIGIISHAEGYYTTALGDYAHAEGYSSYKAPNIIPTLSINTTNDDIISTWKNKKFSLSKNYSHVEGRDSLALGNYSHAEGIYTTASGDYSHAEGYATNAEGNESHAEGSCTHALGYGSHSEGKNTKASSEAQHVQGKYNIEDSNGKYAHIVGNGTSNSKRSNAHTLDWQGNAWYAGDVYIGGTGQDDTNTKKMATEEFVTTKMSTLPQLSFNDVGELVVTIGGVSKVFVPKTEETGA